MNEVFLHYISQAACQTDQVYEAILIFPAFLEKTGGINLLSTLYVGKARLRGATEARNVGERARKGSAAGPVGGSAAPEWGGQTLPDFRDSYGP